MPRASTTSAPDLVRLYLLGAFRIERAARAIQLSTRKVEALLAYLALYPGAHSREKLVALFWGDSSDSDAHTSLRNAFAMLRKKIGADILIADRELAQINPHFPLWVDARQVQQIAEQTAPALNDLFPLTEENVVGLHVIVEQVLATEAHRNTLKISVKFRVVLWQIRSPRFGGALPFPSVERFLGVWRRYCLKKRFHDFFTIIRYSVRRTSKSYGGNYVGHDDRGVYAKFKLRDLRSSAHAGAPAKAIAK